MGTDLSSSLTLGELSRRYKEAVFCPWAKQADQEPLFFKEADGVYLTLANGQKLLDFKSQNFSANLGHNHRGMIEAMVKAAQKGQVISSEVFSEERLALAESLKRIAPQSPKIKLSKVFFTLGGAEANENAIKIARLYTKRHKVITRYRSYHGATLATLNLSGDYRRIALDNAMTGIVRFPDPYPRGSGQNIDTVKLLEEIIEIEGPETIAAILLEGITGANGVFIPPPDYWPRIRRLCDRFGILLIADEVLSGFFRTGTWFGVDHFGVTPDIITMSKGLTAGYAPLGAVLTRKEVADFFDDETLWCGLTQYGHPWACASAHAAIGFYQSDRIEENVKARGYELLGMLEALKEEHQMIAEVRSIGLLAAIDLEKASGEALVPYRASGDALKPVKLLSSLLKEEGLHAIVRFSTLLLAPPLTITASELKEGMEALGRALGRFAEEYR